MAWLNREKVEWGVTIPSEAVQIGVGGDGPRTREEALWDPRG